MPNSNIERDIGALLSTTKALEAMIIEMKREMERDAERVAHAYERSETLAAASRSKIYEKTDELVDRVGAAEDRLKSVENKMAGVEKVTDEVTRWKQMGMGALAVTGLGAASIGAAVATYWDNFIRFLRGV